MLQKHNVTFPVFESLKISKKKNTVCITDENVFEHYKRIFKDIDTIVLKSGEEYKTQETINTIIGQLIDFKTDKTTTLIGVGGGVVTDITGYVASVYMRGIKFGFVPTTLLAMVDASLGGKNGVNFGLHKNFIGTLNQPQFIVTDVKFLKTLPDLEWQNGFAEIIKHACIKDVAMFKQLQQNRIPFYKKNKEVLTDLLKQNSNLKLNIVVKDVNENGDRKLLNFGHTLGHAIETQYELSHGQAISIGMNFACKLSENILQFKDKNKVEELLQQYELPTSAAFDKNKVFSILKMDKKKQQNKMNFILLDKIGKAKVELLEMEEIETYL
ncbi:MAG: 3-dehydroquinate synthase [Bacteroidetes bacterium]|nr:3-dehydroquinate synthase [Bacteroidota bacterium]